MTDNNYSATERIEKQIAEELGIKGWQVTAVIELIDSGCTIPFIARYRKEATGALDDETLRAFDERLKYLRNLEDRKETILSSIEEQGKLTDELRAKTAEQLNEELVAQKKELFNLRFQNATNQLDNSARIKDVRRNIARIQTIIAEKAK